MRHLRAAVTTLVVALGATVAAAPAAPAQEPPPAPVLETCTITPAVVTLRPGEVAEPRITFAPPDSEALFNVTFDGVVVSDGFIPFPGEGPLTGLFGYDELAEEASEILGRPVTDGVVVFTYSGATEVLCTFTITLTTAPEPTTTTVPTTTTTLPTTTAAAPRFTG